MNRSKLGLAVTILIAAGVILILVLNREPGRPSSDHPALARSGTPTIPTGDKPAGFREYPIGDEVVKNHLLIAAVWLPSVGMAGMPAPTEDVIHLEADIKGTADNPNGIAKDEKVAYLRVKYDLRDARTGASLQSGDLMPMRASDGLHYGANIAKPAPGDYRLVYTIEPPAPGGLGMHSDPATGVAPWWSPFEASFDWTMEAPTRAPK